MRGIIIVLTALFLMTSPALAQTQSYCEDAGTLNVTSDVYTDGTREVVTQDVSCQYGCVGGPLEARCNNNPGLMPLPVYIFLGASVFVFLILSFMKNEKNKYVSVFPWIAFILALALAISSPNLEVNGSHFESVPLLYLWGGVSVLMFIIGIYTVIENSQKQLEESDSSRGFKR